MTTEQTPRLQPLGQPGAASCDDDGFCVVPETQQTENTQETTE